MTIIEFILASGIVWGFAMVWEYTKYKHGAKINKRLQERKEDKENARLAAEYDKQYIKERADKMRIEVVEVEEVNYPRNKEPHSYSWEVSHSSQLGQRQVSTQLIIIDNGNS